MFTVDDVTLAASDGLLRARSTACVTTCRDASASSSELDTRTLSQLLELAAHPRLPLDALWSMFTSVSGHSLAPAVRLAALDAQGEDVLTPSGVLKCFDSSWLASDVYSAMDAAFLVFSPRLLAGWLSSLRRGHSALIAERIPRRHRWDSDEVVLATWVRFAPVASLETSLSPRVRSTPASRVSASPLACAALADRLLAASSPVVSADHEQTYLFTLLCSWVHDVRLTLMSTPSGRRLLGSSLCLTASNRTGGDTQAVEFADVLGVLSSWMSHRDCSQYADLPAIPQLVEAVTCPPSRPHVSPHALLAAELADPKLTFGELTEMVGVV